MNTFYEHHHDTIRFTYRCFDRILLNGLIQPFQQPERVIGFFNTYRELYPVSKAVLCDVASQYQHWVTAKASQWGVPIVDAPADARRDTFVEPYFRRAEPDHVVVILKAREPARYLVAIGKDDRWHLEFKRRWPIQYNFYLFDREWGRMFVRVCPYFPFTARLCLNQHHWLSRRMEAEGITFRQAGNMFLTCSDRYLTVQQDILETFVDRGQLRHLAEPTRLPNGKRIPGLKLDHPRQLAVMHALVRFAHIAGGGVFTTNDLHQPAAAALDLTAEQYRLASLRYDLSKLRAKRLVEKVDHSRRYRLLPEGYRICVLFLKLFERVYAPLTAGLLRPVASDARLADEKRHQLDRLYQRIATDLDAL